MSGLFRKIPAGAPPPPVQADLRLVRVPAELLEQAVAVLAPGADFAGEIRCIGEDDGAIVHPCHRLGLYRRQREISRALLEVMHGGGA